MIYDIIIIGGGIAGLSLAIDLKKRNYHIAVIEKGSYPGQKVCGEYISMESHRYLHDLCPALSSLQLPAIHTLKLTSTGANVFKTDLGLGGFGISRYLLEELLYKEALKQGVIFFLNAKAMNVSVVPNENCYQVTTALRVLQARLVCNASGRRSNLETAERGKKGNGTNYIGIKYHVELARDSTQIEIHNFPGGYCGISNVENNKSCLCYIVNAEQLQSVNKSIPDLEKRILSKNKHLEEIFRKARFLSEAPAVISGINFHIKEPLNNSSFFLGDSSGSIAPVTGNGMSMGLRSAYVLAQNIDHYFFSRISKNTLDKNYSEFWHSEFSARIKLSRHFQKLSEYPVLTNMTISLFNLFPLLAKGVISLTHGRPF